MRLDEEQESGNIEDRRGFRVSPGVAGGGIGTIVLVLIALFFGVDPSAILQGTPQSNVSEPAPAQTGARDEGREFVARILGSTERTWGEVFERGGRQYVQPKLVLFSGAAQSACGFAQAAAGPFYCPNDQKVYIDLSFYRELRDRFQAPGNACVGFDAASKATISSAVTPSALLPSDKAHFDQPIRAAYGFYLARMHRWHLEPAGA